MLGIVPNYRGIKENCTFRVPLFRSLDMLFMLGLAFFDLHQVTRPAWKYPRNIRAWCEDLKPQVSSGLALL